MLSGILYNFSGHVSASVICTGLWITWEVERKQIAGTPAQGKGKANKNAGKEKVKIEFKKANADRQMNSGLLPMAPVLSNTSYSRYLPLAPPLLHPSFLYFILTTCFRHIVKEIRKGIKTTDNFGVTQVNFWVIQTGPSNHTSHKASLVWTEEQSEQLTV
jgi:hypothetical protein